MPNFPLRIRPVIEAMSALSAPADLGDVELTAGAAGAARLAGFRTGFFAGFFAGFFFVVRFRAELVWFFRVV